MANTAFKKWASANGHNLNNLSQSEQDNLYVQFIKKAPNGRTSGKTRKTNASTRASKFSKDTQKDKLRNSWVINYLGYDYNTSTGKQRAYFDSDYKRYLDKDAFNAEQLTEDDWDKQYSLGITKCSYKMQMNAHREFDWFRLSTWEYAPMPFETFLGLFKNLSIEKFFEQSEDFCDETFSQYFDFLHDLASANEDIWIDKLDTAKPESNEPVVTWEDLGISTDENGFPLKRNTILRESY